MKIKIDFNLLSLNINHFLKRCGYTRKRQRTGKMSYIRTLRNSDYPRFHIYIDENGLNLHLDQKSPSYSGYKAHSASYSGGLVEKEANRIKDNLITYKK
ncbi:MAG TPA: hypothetical protein VJ900_02180 [Patescibacteria group bacterium]|nr:hypothetical protein [Patescibacteria group bacterium]